MKSEAKIQQEIFLYHWNAYPEQRRRLFMVHNNPRNEIDGARMRGQGMIKGAADMCYLRPGRTPIFLEVKKEDGRQSMEQREWGQMVEANDLGEYYVVRSVEQAKAVCNWDR